jgi:cell division protein FtsL
LTVYSKISHGRSLETAFIFRPRSSSSRLKAARESLDNIGKLNTFLLLGCLLFALAYVYVSNYLVSERYQLDNLKRKFDQSSLELELKKASIIGEISMQEIADYAKSLGMTEANDSEVITKKSNVTIETSVLSGRSNQ